MLHKVSVTSFRKFSAFECDLLSHAVIVGPNNSGKTSLLQAIATWAELGEYWLAGNPDLVRDEKSGAYRHVELNLDGFKTVALSTFNELWFNQATKQPITIRASSQDWEVGFEIRYREPFVALVSPCKDTLEDHLADYSERQIKALYLPSLSGLDVSEPVYGEGVVITRLAHGKGGLVVRNLVQSVSKDPAKWETLQNVLRTVFGYELSMPTGDDPIRVRYRQSTKDQWYDIVNGAAGFLQTVLLQAGLLFRDTSIFLIDEPDAHLHSLLKDQIYCHLREYCGERNAQLLVATHSSRLIEQAAREDVPNLFLISEGGLGRVGRQTAKAAMTLSSEHIVHGQTIRRVLYFEGQSDFDILLHWARTLRHPASSFLEGAFWVPTAEGKQRSFSKRHFSALKALVPTLLGVEIRDRNDTGAVTDGEQEIGKLLVSADRKTPSGLKIAYWNRYEIENYLVHPQAVARFVERVGGKDASDKASAYMRKYLPQVRFDSPFTFAQIDRTKGKSLISDILTAAGVQVPESEYYKIASCMDREEIHPDVVSMLDLTSAHFSIERDGIQM